MRNVVKYFIGLILLTSVSGLGQDTLVVASYNVENLFDTQDDPHKNDNQFLPGGTKEWTEARLANKLDKLARVIGTMAPDIIGLVEIENRMVLERLTDDTPLDSTHYAIVHYESPDARGIDNAILYREATFKLIGSGYHRIDFPDNPRKNTRDILYAVGEVMEKDTLIFVVNHWPSRIGGAEETSESRQYLARELKYMLDTLAVHYPNASVILTGDFNDTPTDTSILIVLNAGDRELNPDVDFVNLALADAKAGQGTYVYRGQNFMLDQIIISPELADKSGLDIVAGSFEVFRAPWLFEQEGKYKGYIFRTHAGKKYLGGYSDHLPVVVKLTRK